MSTAEIVRRAVAEALRMVAAGDVPAPVPAAAVAPDLREKRLKALEKARAAKAAKAAQATPPAAKPKPAAKAAKASADRETFTGHGASIEGFAGVTKRGRKFAGIRVSDAYGRSIMLNKEEFMRLARVLRSEACKDVQAFIELHSA
jgi:hypothetical protein